MTTTLSVSSSNFSSIVADVSDPMTPSYSRCSCLSIAVCVDYGVSCCVIQSFLEYFVVHKKTCDRGFCFKMPGYFCFQITLISVGDD